MNDPQYELKIQR